MNIFYFVRQWPKNKSNSSSDKTVSTIETLINMGHKISLLSTDTNPLQTHLQQIPIETTFVNPKKIGPTLGSLAIKPDLAIFNCHQI